MATRKLLVWDRVRVEGVGGDLVLLTPKQAGFRFGADRAMFLKEATSRFGLALCPAGFAEKLKISYADQPVGEVIRVPEEARDGKSPEVFIVRAAIGPQRSLGSLLVEDRSSEVSLASEKWLFVLPLKPPKAEAVAR